MSKITAIREISAPPDLVFETVSQINNFSKAIPEIVDIEFLTEKREGVGTRFKETREINGRRATVELEVVEFVAGSHIRILSDTHGTVWDSIFTVQDVNGESRLTLEMEARPHTFFARLTTAMAKGVIAKALEKDMDAVKTYCEGLGNS